MKTGSLKTGGRWLLLAAWLLVGGLAPARAADEDWLGALLQLSRMLQSPGPSGPQPPGQPGAQNPPGQQGASGASVLTALLTPAANLAAGSPAPHQRAVNAVLALEEMTGLPPSLRGVRLQVAFQPPDRLLLRGVLGGKEVAVCRAGQTLWITPNPPPFAADMALPPEPLLPATPAQQAAHGNDRLGPMTLPVPAQLLKMLPLFLQIEERPVVINEAVFSSGPAPSASPAATPTATPTGKRVTVRLHPQIARTLEAEGWSLTLLVNGEGHLRRVQVEGPGQDAGVAPQPWRLSLGIEQLAYRAALPPATWEAPPGALKLNAWQVKAWLAGEAANGQ